jgi:transposase
MNVAGIDVGCEKVVSAVGKDGGSQKAREFANDPAGHGSLIKALQNARVTRVCVEATGVYHVDLAVALHDAGFEVMVVNPKAARRFAEAMMARAKTDPVDAALRLNSPRGCRLSRGRGPPTTCWPCAPLPATWRRWSNCARS